jgi:hypothetical protein
MSRLLKKRDYLPVYDKSQIKPDFKNNGYRFHAVSVVYCLVYLSSDYEVLSPANSSNSFTGIGFAK